MSSYEVDGTATDVVPLPQLHSHIAIAADNMLTATTSVDISGGRSPFVQGSHGYCISQFAEITFVSKHDAGGSSFDQKIYLLQ